MVPTIIIVEDDDVFRGLLTEVLEDLGYEVFAYREAEALNMHLLAKLKPAMAIVDLRLPGIGGDQLCKVLAVACRTFGMKVLLTSNADEEELARYAAAVGADAHVTKRKLLADPEAALRDLIPDALVDAELVDEPTVTTPQAAVGRAVEKHLENFRARVEIRVECEIPAAIRDARGGTFRGILKNLSTRGACVELSSSQPAAYDALPVGEPISLGFPLEGTGNLAVDARIAWRRSSPPDRVVAVMGVRFDDLPPPIRERLDAFLRKGLEQFLGGKGQ